MQNKPTGSFFTKNPPLDKIKRIDFFPLWLGCKMFEPNPETEKHLLKLRKKEKK